MSYTLKLDTFSHDLIINGGKFKRISGAAEVCQRVKIALWHYFDEYFLDRQHGIPYYSKKNIGDAIMGSKMSRQTLYNLFRKKILAVPGVLQVKQANITRLGRDYYYSCKIIVAPGPKDTAIQEIQIQNIALGG